ncbi:MAG: 4-(cytidine 5'-diphospho)-2-C-methyl-D-erythritol kinase [Victivallales bacterium]|nr:4-(cytidine 5'-diphospho)-2-C-methyl-D-erythritol kinase [Victivallales bacterium]
MASSFPVDADASGTVRRRRSPAKTNLRLKVTSRRPDGYHELETLFIPLQCPADVVTIDFAARQNGIATASDDPTLPVNAANIAGKAAAAYCRTAGITPSMAIFIHKEIPVAAGLGGGSANAATVLLLLQEYYRALNGEQLAELAVTLGADVPFFLHSRPAVATGIGEKFTPATFDPTRLPLLIAAPDFPVSAAWAYRHLNPSAIGPAPGMTAMLAAIAAADWKRVGALLCNDLAAALYEKFPLLVHLRQELLTAGALGAEISGSGPSMLAIFADRAGAAAAATAIQTAFEGKIRTFVAMGET